MINSFRLLGQDILNKAGYYRENDAGRRRKILLDNLSLVPQAKTDKSGEPYLESKAICLNFDLSLKTVELKIKRRMR